MKPLNSGWNENAAERETASAVEHGLGLVPGDTSSARVMKALQADAYKNAADPAHADAVAAAQRAIAERGGAQAEDAPQDDAAAVEVLRHELGGVRMPDHLSKEQQEIWSENADVERQFLGWAQRENVSGAAMQQVFDLYSELARLNVPALSNDGLAYFKQHVRGLSAGQVSMLIEAARELGL